MDLNPPLGIVPKPAMMGFNVSDKPRVLWTSILSQIKECSGRLDDPCLFYIFAWLASLFNSEGGSVVLPLSSPARSQMERLPGFQIVHSEHTAAQAESEIRFELLDDGNTRITIPRGRSRTWTVGSAVVRFGEKTTKPRQGVEQRTSHQIASLPSESVMDWLYAACGIVTTSWHPSTQQAVPHLLDESLHVMEDNRHEKKSFLHPNHKICDVLSDERKAVVSWKLRIMLRSVPEETYVHLLLGAPDLSVEQRKLSGFSSSIVNSLAAPAELLRLQYLDYMDPPGWYFAETCSSEERARQTPISSLGSVGLFLHDSTDATLLADVQNSIGIICHPSTCFPRIQEANAHVHVYMLATPNPLSMEEPHFTVLRKNWSEDDESDAGANKDLAKLLSVVGSRCVCVHATLKSDLDLPEGSDSQKLALHAGDKVFGVLYDAHDSHEDDILVRDILSKYGLRTWQLAGVRSRAALRTTGAGADRVAADEHESMIGLQAFRSVRKRAVFELMKPLVGDMRDIVVGHRYGVLVSACHSDEVLLVKSPKATGDGLDDLIDPWQVGMYVQCDSPSEDDVEREPSVRLVGPVSTWLLARARRFHHASTAATRRFAESDVEKAHALFHDLLSWQLEHPRGTIRCEADSNIISALINHARARGPQVFKGHSQKWKPLRIVLEVEEKSIRAHGDLAILAPMQRLITAALLVVVDVVCIHNQTEGDADSISHGLVQVPTKRLMSLTSSAEGDEGDHAAAHPSAHAQITTQFEKWLRIGIQQDIDLDIWSTVEQMPELSSVREILTAVTRAVNSEAATSTVNIGRADGSQPCGMTSALLKSAQQLAWMTCGTKPLFDVFWWKSTECRRARAAHKPSGMCLERTWIIFAELQGVTRAILAELRAVVRAARCLVSKVVVVQADHPGVGRFHFRLSAKLSLPDFREVTSCWQQVAATHELEQALSSMLREAERDGGHWNRHLFLPGIVSRRGSYAPVATICSAARTVIDAIDAWEAPIRGFTAVSFKQILAFIFATRILVPRLVYIKSEPMDQIVESWENAQKVLGNESRFAWADVQCLLHRASTGVCCVHPDLAAVFLQVDFPFDPQPKIFRPTTVDWVTVVHPGLRYCLSDGARSPHDKPSSRLAYIDLHPNPKSAASGASEGLLGLWFRCLIEWLCRQVVVDPSSLDHHVDRFNCMIADSCCGSDAVRTAEKTCRLASRALLAYQPPPTGLSYFLASRTPMATDTTCRSGAEARQSHMLLTGDNEAIHRAAAAVVLAKRAVQYADHLTRSVLAEAQAQHAHALLAVNAVAAGIGAADGGISAAASYDWLQRVAPAAEPVASGSLLWVTDEEAFQFPDPETHDAVITSLRWLSVATDGPAESNPVYRDSRLVAWLKRWTVFPTADPTNVMSGATVPWLERYNSTFAAAEPAEPARV